MSYRTCWVPCREISVIDFCYDDLGQHGIGYPNLAVPGLAPHEFDGTWPRSIAFRPNMYLRSAQVQFRAHRVDQAPAGSWYPVALGWHDFDCDYVSVIPASTLTRVRQGQIRILFYYHEGDHPGRIQQRLDGLCVQHDLPLSYLLISANTAADQYARAFYFSDHELFFRYVNRRQPGPPITDTPRPYEFTLLNRTHKWWRASIMSDLHRHGVLDNSLWSYNVDCGIQDPWSDNPLSVMSDETWFQCLQTFMHGGPYHCDDLGADRHNDHRSVNVALYHQSYCHVVIETLFDVDQSQAAFLTEKTYKCIKFAQPFVIAGGPGSVAALRAAGYRVFDHAIDHGYDNIQDNDQRWQALRAEIQRLGSQDMHAWFQSCVPDLYHNQALYQQPLLPSLRRLVDRLSSSAP